nr:CdaR family protein [bacterium]
MSNIVTAFFKKIWTDFRHNWGYKVIAIIFALILWSYVLTETNPMRTIVYRNINVVCTGLEQLEGNKLMLSESIESKARVSIRLQQSDAQLLNKSAIRIVADVSEVTEAGQYSIPLKATTPYGQPVQIVPESIEIKVEPLEIKQVPVECQPNVELPESAWLAMESLSPATIRVSGPVTMVDRVAKAIVRVDNSQVPSEFSESVAFELVDADGRTLQDNTLKCDVAAVVVKRNIYRKLQVPVKLEGSLIDQAELADGMVVDNVRCLPESVWIAGPEEILQDIDGIQVAPFAIGDEKQSFTRQVALLLPDGVVWCDYHAVDVVVELSQEQAHREFKGLQVQQVTKTGLEALEEMSASVTVTGPRMLVEALTAQDIQLLVDGRNLVQGEHEVAIMAVLPEKFQGLTVTVSPSVVTILVS